MIAPDKSTGSWLMKTSGWWLVASGWQERGVLLLALCSLVVSLPAAADDEDELIAGCHLSVGEFGTEAVHICISENQEAMKAVRQYPREQEWMVTRCEGRKEAGWVFVKRCIDADIAALPIVKSLAEDHIELVEACDRKLGTHGPAMLKACVEQELERRKP
jgi:hypothetical protein